LRWFDSKNDPENEQWVEFIYATKAGKVSSTEQWYVIDIDLKPGWNTVIYSFNSVVTGMPGNNFKWVIE
jgi:hypothetical protein